MHEDKDSWLIEVCETSEDDNWTDFTSNISASPAKPRNQISTTCECESHSLDRLVTPRRFHQHLLTVRRQQSHWRYLICIHPTLSTINGLFCYYTNHLRILWRPPRCDGHIFKFEHLQRSVKDWGQLRSPRVATLAKSALKRRTVNLQAEGTS
jgi:hypothetical protein